MIGIHL
jgi:hypothetical protein